MYSIRQKHEAFLKDTYEKICIESIQILTQGSVKINTKKQTALRRQVLFFSLAALCSRLCGIPILMNELIKDYTQDIAGNVFCLQISSGGKLNPTSAMLDYPQKHSSLVQDCQPLRIANSLSAYR